MNVTQAIRTYQDRFDSLLPYEGQYVLLHGDDEVDGYWDTYEEALRVGYQRFGLKPFFVKKIEREESVHFFTRGLPECRD